jgi:hypothetical protein
MIVSGYSSGSAGMPPPVVSTSPSWRAVLADLPALPGDPLPASARRRRGHGHADAPEADWRPTNERFRDTRTNRVMRVWEDAGGQRHYVVDDEA